MKKFKARYIVIPLLILSVAGIAAWRSSEKKATDSVANVIKVSDVVMYNGESLLDSYHGTLKKGSVQNVKFDDTLKIDEVKVKKGDKVSKGDVLFTYDTSSLIFKRDDANNQITTIENDIKIANNELSILKNLRPSEDAPNDNTSENAAAEETVDVPLMRIVETFDYEKKITLKSKADLGKGTSDDPFVFYVGTDTVVTKEYLKSLAGEEAKFAVFYVCDEDGTPIFARFVDGTKISLENASDWSVCDGVNMTDDGSISFDGSTSEFASFIIQSGNEAEADGEDAAQMIGEFSPEEIASMYGFTADMLQPQESSNDSSQESADTDYELSTKDDYLYSKEELKTMISEKESQIESLGLQKKQAEIDVRKAEKLLETGAELASLSGTVTFVAKDIYHLADSGAYITITSSSGMSLSSSIGEFSLSKIEVGMAVTVKDWGSGNKYDGEITFINDTPTASLSTATESFYEFVVTVTEEMSIGEDSNVSVQLVNDETADMFQLMSMFVRSEGSKHYVMVVNEDNVLEKRYVKVGKSYFGYVTEIIDGLSRDEMIAIPYGKTVEGMSVREVTYDEILYGTSILR